MYAAEAIAGGRVLGAAVLYQDDSGKDSLASPDLEVSRHQMSAGSFTLYMLTLVSGTPGRVKSSWEDGNMGVSWRPLQVFQLPIGFSPLG